MPVSSIPGLRELLLCTFPQLSRCSFGFTLGDRAAWSSKEKDDLAAFLLRHPALETLYIPAMWPSMPTTRLPLDRLQQLRCPAALRLDWYDCEGGVPSDVEKTIVALKSMTRTDVPFVCSIGIYTLQFAEIVDSISRNLPHTKTLCLTLSLPFQNAQGLTDQIMNCLPRFTGLVYLSLEGLPYYTLRDTEKEDQQMAQAFGDVCPALEACRLNRFAWRNANGTWEEYPVKDFEEMSTYKGHGNLMADRALSLSYTLIAGFVFSPVDLCARSFYT
ncbi:hypothetical protein FB451DRAFT_1552412 [Mycena latifolia]|nr:hypothetical protein FB451DRAFT_1552412 [Mycena latifolia]